MFSKNIDQMKLETQQHIDADAVAQGTYWDNGKGCFIGCLTHSNKAEMVTERFGLPLPSVKIAERIFEHLPEDQAVEFFKAIPDAIGHDGKDLSKVHWAFLKDVLEHLPKQAEEVQAVITPVIEGMGLLVQGKDWPNASYAAAYAANAANAANAAAYAAYAANAANAAYAANAANAAYAANAANAAADRDVEILRQRDVFLELLGQ